MDTGIDQNSFEPKKFKEFYSKGDMYSETQDSPWWLSADIHGTQMAKLVTAIDPYCKLFIAKVGDHKTGITRSAFTKVGQHWIQDVQAPPLCHSFIELLINDKRTPLNATLTTVTIRNSTAN
jgi:hypothetical protein